MHLQFDTSWQLNSVRSSHQMNLLQIPIIDEYWVAPQDPASHLRSPDLAIQLGFGHGFAYDSVAASA